MYSVKKIADSVGTLIESPIWCRKRNSLFFVDILEGNIYECFLQKGLKLAIQTGNYVGCISMTESGQVAVAVADGIWLFRPNDGGDVLTLELDAQCIGSLPLRAGMRFNDGKCDAQGRLWIGTMAIDQTGKDAVGAGSLYCFSDGKNAKQVLTGLTIPNGMAWREDRQLFYHTDTKTSCIKEYNWNEDCCISYIREAVRIPEGEGVPDGMAMDSEGMIWVAQWGGYKVARYNPATGKQLDEICLPDKNVSSCAFGGDELNYLYITTARDEIGRGGSVYEVFMEVKGVEAYPLRLKKE